EIRQNMTVEEEFFSAIDTRDAAIADRDAKISSQESIIADSCRLLLNSGMTLEEISKSLKMNLQQLSYLLDNS
ncbi:MAG: hypothetical protein MJY77_07205, partial [Bacteroidaceae bacterium]|nr:hypothetical protein [Bacteroidaceae bacterium]